MEIIAHIETDFKSKFGLPRQSGIIEEIEGRIVFHGQYRNPDALRGLEDFSHIWILWQFSESKKEGWSATVRPPLLGGNKRMGVFATRSPYRPNPIGLSSVRLLRIEQTEKEGPVLIVCGCDLMDGTPIYDIKPYLPYCDCHEDATGGFTDTLGKRILQVNCPDSLIGKIPPEKRTALISALEGDPRPSYQHDPERVYGFTFADWEIKFKVENSSLVVTDIKNL